MPRPIIMDLKVQVLRIIFMNVKLDIDHRETVKTHYYLAMMLLHRTPDTEPAFVGVEPVTKSISMDMKVQVLRMIYRTMPSDVDNFDFINEQFGIAMMLLHKKPVENEAAQDKIEGAA